MTLTTCLRCGSELTPHAGRPQSTPFVCHLCHLGYFPSELSREARNAYRRTHHDFGYHAHAIRDAVHADLEAAIHRGTCALPEQLPLFTLAELEFLMRFGLHADFLPLVKAAIAAKVGMV